MSKLSALETFMKKLRGVPDMPIKTAGSKILDQFGKTGTAMKDSPRASIGGAAAGLGISALLGGSDDDDDEKAESSEAPDDDELVAYLKKKKGMA